MGRAAHQTIILGVSWRRYVLALVVVAPAAIAAAGNDGTNTIYRLFREDFY
jgi:hypothetical protein